MFPKSRINDLSSVAGHSRGDQVLITDIGPTNRYFTNNLGKEQKITYTHLENGILIISSAVYIILVQLKVIYNELGY